MKGQTKNILAALWKDFRSRLGLIILATAVLISIGGAYLRPDSTKNANDQQLSLAKKKPGFKATFIRVERNEKAERNLPGQGLFFGGLKKSYSDIPIASYRVQGDRMFYVPYGEEDEQSLYLADLFFSLKSETYKSGDTWLQFYDYENVLFERNIDYLVGKVGERIVDRTYYLGTDTFGRDLLSRLLGGVIFSLSVGLISVLISLLIGITLGAIAGFYRGWIDNVIMWFVNVIWSIPTLLMVIAITLVLGKGFVQVFVAVGLTMWVEVARIVRGQVIGVRELNYIEATKALGFSDRRIISKHILPNIMGPVIVISAANFASAILIEAGLSFLGIGAQIPMPSWGMMIKEHYYFITTDLAYLAIIPGLCIMFMVLSLMLIGNSLRDIYDVKS